MKLVEYAASRVREFIGNLHSLAERGFDLAELCLREGDCRRQEFRRLAREALKLKEDVSLESVYAIARYQPVARHLRFFVASMEVAYDLLRITRYLYETVRTAMLARCDYSGALEALSRAREMVRLAVKSYMEGDVSVVSRVFELDGSIDRFYREKLEEVASRESVSNCDALEAVLARHVERVADHATYIACAAYYVATGERHEYCAAP